MATKCIVCGNEVKINHEFFEELYCENCIEKYPKALLKALFDPFDYMIGLKNGDVFRFEYAEIKGDWLFLTRAGSRIAENECDLIEPFRGGIPFPRGVWIRLDEIAWVADAPYGS